MWPACSVWPHLLPCMGCRNSTVCAPGALLPHMEYVTVLPSFSVAACRLPGSSESALLLFMLPDPQLRFVLWLLVPLVLVLRSLPLFSTLCLLKI